MITSIRRFSVCAAVLSTVALAQLNFVPLTIHVQRADGSSISSAKVDVREIMGPYDPNRYGYHLSGTTDEHGDYHFTGSIQDTHRVEVVAKDFSTALCDNFQLQPMRKMVVTMKPTAAPSTSAACTNSDPPVQQRRDN